MRPRSFVAFTFATLAALPVFAHIQLQNPPPRFSPNGLKTGPCGSGTRTGTITPLSPGQTLTVKWKETVGHSGHYRIAFSAREADFTEPTSLAIPATTPAWVLADGIVDKTGTQTYSVDVRIPNAPCPSCVLQLIQVMGAGTDGTNTGSFSGLYFECADVTVAAAQPDAGTVPDATAPDAAIKPDVSADRPTSVPDAPIGGVPSATGGVTATGGVSSTGGGIATGGVRATGAATTGGMTATGGVATGGMTSTGGIAATAGTTATGGVQGGAGGRSTGGTLATGGVTTTTGGTIVPPSTGGSTVSGNSTSGGCSLAQHGGPGSMLLAAVALFFLRRRRAHTR